MITVYHDIPSGAHSGHLGFMQITGVSTGIASSQAEAVGRRRDVRYCPLKELPPGATSYIYLHMTTSDNTRQQYTPGFHKHDHSFRSMCRRSSTSTVVNRTTGFLRQQHMIYSSDPFVLLWHTLHPSCISRAIANSNPYAQC